jgi:C1A family cysteine protease
MGCLPAKHDKRDLALWNAAPAALAARVVDLVGTAGFSAVEFQGPATSDLSQYVTRCEDQGQTQDCVGYAWSYASEILWQRTLGKSKQLDPRFIATQARWFENRPPDTATSIRSGASALRTFGAPPIVFSSTPFSEARQFSYASNYKISAYWNCNVVVNEWGAVDSMLTLNQVRVLLSAGCPAAFGFYVFDEAWTSGDGIIHYPADSTLIRGGHAVCAIGHDDNMNCGASGQGALRIINSWGTAWGQQGLGWLPYKYWQSALAWDAFAATTGTWTEDL